MSQTSDDEDKLAFITEMLKRLEPDIASIKEKVEDVYSRRSNLIFFNIEENKQPLEAKMQTISSELGVPDSDKMICQTIHRMGKQPSTTIHPRPVIIRFAYLSDRQTVWDARSKLKGKKYSLNEDLPGDYKKKTILKAARASGAKASMVANKVKIDGRLYSVDQMKEIPCNCNPELACVKENENSLCFFRRYSPLRNFYRCQFRINNTTYTTMEQFIQQSKAEVMGGDVTAAGIRSQQNPSIIKQMGKSIKGNTHRWFLQAKELALPALKERFRQKPKILSYLLVTDDKVLGEASTDKFWGIGLHLENPHVHDQNMWSGKNVVDDILMRVRAELKIQC